MTFRQRHPLFVIVLIGAISLVAQTALTQESVDFDAVYRIKEEVLPITAGGPVRFFIWDSAACQSAEVDECANVKFLDHIELTVERGFDNRPEDEEEHARLHREQES